MEGVLPLLFKKLDVVPFTVFDQSEAAVQHTREKGIRSVEQLDVTRARSIPKKGDLCLCLEVAEHIPKCFANHFCYLLSEAAPVLAVSAAPPGQGGHLHVNEQPRDYWIELFEKYGMKYDHEALSRIRTAFNGEMIWDYDKNLMVFRK